MQWTYAHYLHRMECPRASEILRGTISKFRYMLYIMSLQKVSMNEGVTTFK